MNKDVIAIINHDFNRFPGTRGLGASDDEIRRAEAAIACRFHPDYVEFLRLYGCGIVGPNRIFGIGDAEDMGVGQTVTDETRRYRVDGWFGVDDWYIISDDGYGNPIGVRPDGAVMISDHDHGCVDKLADSFEDFLVKWCLNP